MTTSEEGGNSFALFASSSWGGIVDIVAYCGGMASAIPGIVFVVVAALVFFTVTGQWALRLIVSLFVTSLRFSIAIYQVSRIIISLTLLMIIRLYRWTKDGIEYLKCLQRGTAGLRARVARAKDYETWLRREKRLEDVEGITAWRSAPASDAQQKSGPISKVDFATVEMVTERMMRDLVLSGNQKEKMQSLLNSLPGFLARNFSGSDSRALHSRSLVGTNYLIEDFRIAILSACDRLTTYTSEQWTSQMKRSWFEKMRLSYGRTALCLSGGGSLAMYHLGVVDALIDAHVLPRVISGTSGGSIVAGMLAIKTKEELQGSIIKSDIAERYLNEGISFFPPLLEQIRHFVKNRFLVDSKRFERCCKRYYGSWTFREAFNKTRRVVNISVTLSGGTEKILLNHVTAGNVYIWSAVAASCALPGIMAPVPLMAKGDGSSSKRADYEYLPRGQHVCDGSILADLPQQRLSELFGVTNFIVSQVNPHVVPFLRSSDGSAASESHQSSSHPLAKLEAMVNGDIRSRCQMLSKLGVLPKFYGQRLGGVFKQKYHGRVTIVPRFGISDSFKAIQNPTKAHMDLYLLEGRRATWPKLAYIKHLLAVENKLEECLLGLRGEAKRMRRASSSGNEPKPLAATVIEKPIDYSPPKSDADTEDGIVTPTSPLNMRHRFSVCSEDSDRDIYRGPLPHTTDAPKSSMEALREETNRLRLENEQLRKQVKQLLALC